MAYPNLLDDELTVPATVSKPAAARVTAGFNLALLAFQAVSGFLVFLASERARAFPLSGILLSSAIDLARFVIVMLISACFIRGFWQRLVANVAPVRPIDFQEALSIALMASLLVGR